MGYQVRLIPPACVKPFVKCHKNDALDAEAICEAAQRPSMPFLAVETEEQQAALVFRTRDLAVKQRTRLGNAICGHLVEYDWVAPKGAAHLAMLADLLDGGKIDVRHDDRYARRSGQADCSVGQRNYTACT